MARPYKETNNNGRIMARPYKIKINENSVTLCVLCGEKKENDKKNLHTIDIGDGRLPLCLHSRRPERL